MLWNIQQGTRDLVAVHLHIYQAVYNAAISPLVPVYARYLFNPSYR